MREISDIEKKAQEKSRLAIYFGEHVWDTYVYLDGRPIGVIQEIKLTAKANDAYPQVEVTFPELYKKCSPELIASVEKYIEDLKSLPYVKISFCPEEESKKENAQEVTDSDWSSSEDDFQKSLNMVTDAKES